MSENGCKIEGDKLIITLNLKSQELSKSRKSFMLATSNGFKNIGDISVSYNVIRKK